MKIVIDLPMTEEEIMKELEEQRKEFIRMGLLPYEAESESEE